MDVKELSKIDGILKIVDEFVIPLAEKGAQLTKNPMDDLVVSFLKGGVREVRGKINQILQNPQLQSTG